MYETLNWHSMRPSVYLGALRLRRGRQEEPEGKARPLQLARGHRRAKQRGKWVPAPHRNSQRMKRGMTLERNRLQHRGRAGMRRTRVTQDVKQGVTQGVTQEARQEDGAAATRRSRRFFPSFPRFPSFFSDSGSYLHLRQRLQGEKDFFARRL